MMSVKEFTNMEECCYMDDLFDKCSSKTMKDSFFCRKHKPLLFKTEEFVLLHSGNKKKILEDMKIKTAKEAGVKGIGGFMKKPFEQVFTNLMFPNFNHGIYGYSETEKQGIKKGEGGHIFINPTILRDIAKVEKDIEIHLTANTAAWGFFVDISIRYERMYSVRENLNRMYHFFVLIESRDAIKHWKQSDKKRSFRDIRKEVFTNEDASNELVFSESLPLIIGSKNYIEESEKYYEQFNW
jgi:hypothetical protein